MGFRTLVLLNNDAQLDWENGPLGKQIACAQHGAFGAKQGDLGYAGTVVQCCHADQESLFFVEGLGAHELRYGTLTEGTDHAVANSKQLTFKAVETLKAVADRLGYKLIKKPLKAKKPLIPLGICGLKDCRSHSKKIGHGYCRDCMDRVKQRQRF